MSGDDVHDGNRFTPTYTPTSTPITYTPTYTSSQKSKSHIYANKTHDVASSSVLTSTPTYTSSQKSRSHRIHANKRHEATRYLLYLLPGPLSPSGNGCGAFSRRALTCFPVSFVFFPIEVWPPFNSPRESAFFLSMSLTDSLKHFINASDSLVHFDWSNSYDERQWKTTLSWLVQVLGSMSDPLGLTRSFNMRGNFSLVKSVPGGARICFTNSAYLCAKPLGYFPIF